MSFEWYQTLFIFLYIIKFTTSRVILQDNLVCQGWASYVEVGSLIGTQELGVKFLGWTQE